MFGWEIWTSSAHPGTMIEIPARAPGLAANLWIHVAVNTVNWIDFTSQGVSQTNWSRSTIYASVAVEPGDIPVASLACMGLAGMQREKQGAFDSDTWGIALDSLAPTAPSSLAFSGDFATSGRAWPGGIWLLADVLVLRPSLIPPVPTPFGTYPAPSHHWKWPFEQYVSLVQNIKSLTKDQWMLLRRLHRELDELMTDAAAQKRKDHGDATPHEHPAVKPAKVSLKIAGWQGADSAPATTRHPEVSAKPRESIAEAPVKPSPPTPRPSKRK